MDLRILAVAGEQSITSQATDFDWATLVTSALVAAVISALVAILGQWVARQNAKLGARIARDNAILSADLEVATTLAKSRQEWINVLREDLALFAGLAARRSRAIALKGALDDDDFERMVALSGRIRMRLNPADEDFHELFGLMSACSLEENASELGVATGKFIEVSQRLLKREWEVLKMELRSLGVRKGDG